MLVSQWTVGPEAAVTESGASRLAQRRAEHHHALWIETDETGIEGSIPIGGKKEAVMDVETLGVIFALGPRLDMTGTQELRLGDAGNGATPLPVVEQAGTKLCLAETTADKRLHLGTEFLTGAGERILEAFQWRVRQSAGELPDSTNEGG